VFNKAAKPDPRSESSSGSGGAKKPRGAPSLLGADLVVEGRLSGAGEVHVDGRVIGEVRIGRLTVGEDGFIEGAIEADYVDIRGRVVGSIKAASVRIAASAHVEAEITHQQMSMEAGAYFQGRCMQVADFVAERPPLLEAHALVTPQTLDQTLDQSRD
jgi:cytoskeletal protein CcmA (bactofilin family)